MAKSKKVNYDVDQDFGMFIMYEKFKQWLESREAEKEDRDKTLTKLAEWAGVEKRSPLALMLISFVAGADAGVDLIDSLQRSEKEESPACEEAQTGQAATLRA